MEMMWIGLCSLVWSLVNKESGTLEVAFKYIDEYLEQLWGGEGNIKSLFC